MSASEPNPYETPSLIEGPTDPDAMREQNLPLVSRLAIAALGLKLIYWGCLLLLITFLGMMASSAVFNAARFPGTMGQLALVGFALVMFVSSCAINLGPLLCLLVPRGYWLRPLSVAVVITIGLFWIATILNVPFSSSDAGVFMIPVGSVLFLAFLYRLAQVIERSDLVRRCRYLFVFGSIVLLVTLVTGPTTNWGPAKAFSVAIEVLCMLGLLAVMLMYLNLMNAIANAIRYPDGTKGSFSIF